MRLPEHQHRETQVEVHFRRSWDAKSNGKPLVANIPGETELVAPGRPHVGEWEDDSEVVVVLIPPHVFERAADEILVRSKFAIFDRRLQSEPFIQRLASSFLNQFHSPTGLSRLAVESTGYLLAEHILRNYAETAPIIVHRDRFDPRNLREITAFVDQYLEGGLTVADMARVTNMGVHRFGRLLRLATGRSAWQFVQSRRVEVSKTLLRNHKVSLAEIAFRLGFASQSHFTAVFHRATGTTPNSYRRAFRGR